MPGVYVLIWVNSAFGADYRHRQCLITNLICLSWLSRDCPGTHNHQILSGTGRPTSTVSPFAQQLVSHWAGLCKAYVDAPMSLRCPHCAHAEVNYGPMKRLRKNQHERC